MSDAWLALTWIVVIAAVGGVVSAWLFARAKTAQARVAKEIQSDYQQLLSQQSLANETVARELSHLDERLASVEKLLRDVG